MSIETRQRKLVEVVDIKLDETDDAVYHPGDVITGRLIVSSQSDIDQQICELSVRVQGKAATNFETGSALMPTPHIGHEIYFDGFIFLQPQDGTKLTIEPGALEEYPFSITIPAGKYPCGYQGSCGYVKYSIRGALIPYPVGKQDMEDVEASFVDKDINLVSVYDTSICPGMNEPIQITWSSVTNNCCLRLCKKNKHPFTFSLDVPKSCFVTGESFECVVNFDNESRHKSPEIFVNFVQQTVFVADDKVEKEGQSKTIAIQKGPMTTPGEKVQANISFVVPEDSLPSRLGGCSIIRHDYYIEAEIDLDNTNLVTIRRPISIGSVNNSK